MGQQQLLLVVLTVIVVGIAIVIGIHMFNEGAESANIDAVVNDVVNMAARAQQYYIKPTAMGGGGHSFSGLTIADIGESSNDNGTYSVSAADQQVTITATCAIAKKEDGTPVTVVAVVTSSSVSTTVNN